MNPLEILVVITAAFDAATDVRASVVINGDHTVNCGIA